MSPAKSLDYESPLPTRRKTEPRLLARSQELIDLMITKTAPEIERLMSISPALAELNHGRYRDWKLPRTSKLERPALLAFNGDVYTGLDARASFTPADFTRAQKTLRILSGLYGVLRPLDLMMPYRLEMGTRLSNARGRDLYDFWGNTITELLAADLAESPGAKVLINLASQEYFGAVRPSALAAPIVSPVFVDAKGEGSAKIISFFAKRARGVMAGWIIRERISRIADLTSFDGSGYRYVASRSTPERPVFERRQV